jgi:hypothetical protein
MGSGQTPFVQSIDLESQNRKSDPDRTDRKHVS